MNGLGIKSRILLPAVVMLASLLTIVVLGVWSLQRKHLEDSFLASLTSIDRLFRLDSEEKGDVLHAMSRDLIRQKRFEEVWKSGDNNELNRIAKTFFEERREASKLLRVLFRAPDGSILAFASDGVDPKEKYSAFQAFKTSADDRSVALDMEPKGALGLTHLLPYLLDGKLVGYVEIVQDATDLLDIASEILDIDAALLLADQSQLDRKAWDLERDKLPDREAFWNLHKPLAFVGCSPDESLDTIPLIFRNAVWQSNPDIAVSRYNDSVHYIGLLVLRDVRNIPCGQLAVSCDMTKQEAALEHFIVLLLGGSTLFLILLLSGASWYLNRIERRIESADRKVIAEMTTREAEQAKHLRELTRFREALDGTADAISICDVNGKVVYLNSAFQKMFGWSSEDLNAKEGGLLSLFEGTQIEKNIFGAFTKGENWTGEIEMSDGRRRLVPMLFRGNVIQDADGESVGLLGIFTDISERKFAENQLRKQAKALQESNVSLQKANQAAQAATVAKSEFLANMSHEIRTPMTAILGFSDVLLDRAVPEDERLKATEIIRRNGQYLLQIINDVLDLSKIEAGRMECNKLACSPLRIVSEVISLMDVRAREKGLKLFAECDGPIPETIQSDPTRLRQVLINLVGNAVKFTEAGEVRLRISLRSPMLEFLVVDTGIGIDEEQLERIFKPFTQADETVTRRFGGTGLGLAICRRFAEVLDASISVESRKGVGSTFRFLVPTGPLDGVKILDNPQVALQAVDQEAASHDVERLSKLECRILLAEDGLDNQRLISLVLRKAGAVVDVAENGKEALDMLEAARQAGNDYDVVLMDMQMPVLDGYAAAGEIRARDYRVPVIALTAHAMVEDRQKCLDAGCDYYATKPIRRDVLIETIRAAVNASLRIQA